MDNIDLVHLFFRFDGRINRAKLWLAWVVLNVIFVIVGVIGGYPSTAYYIASVLAIWPFLAISIKRWHDRDKSGWWVLIAFIPIIGWIWTIVELGFLPGTDGPNQYGDDPLAVHGAST